MTVDILLLITLELASTEDLAAAKKGLLRKNHFLAIRKQNLTCLLFSLSQLQQGKVEWEKQATKPTKDKGQLTKGNYTCADIVTT